ncbi:MAG: N-methyl-L-tryptophan oxidase [Actinomycetota bacterium]|nr:N-methyl-L-tryptophan oxidase [Actinomycetota bacterium]
MSTYDVIVVGLGGMGSAAARHLAARGQRVLGLERFTPAHDQGSSHGGSRIIRQSYFEDPAYVPLLLRSYELFEETERAAGTELLTVTGGLYMGPTGCTTFAGSLHAAREWGLDHEVLDAAETHARFPTITLPEGHGAVYERLGGYVRPEATVSAHLELAARDGADLRFGQVVEKWTAGVGGVAVRTAEGETHSAAHLVISPGAWAPQLLADLGVELHVERHVQHWFRPPGGVGPFVDHPIYICEIDDGRQIYGFPAMDGPDGGVKTAFFRNGRPADPDALDRVVAPAEVDEIRERLSHTLPTLAGEHLEGVACMYTVTPDEHFVIAHHPAHEQVTVACGFSGHGFKFVPAVGEVVADLATCGTTRHPIGLFDPARFAG